jgi:hypothetical protein
MAHVAWTLTDNSTGSPVVLSFDINPNSFDAPGRNTNIVSEQVTAPNGQTLVFQGRDASREATLSGAVTTQTFFSSLDTWKDKNYPLVLTDDQGSTWNVLIKSWRWTRLRRTNNWRYDYTATVMVL